MTYQWYDFVGNAGVLTILCMYLFLQLGKIESTNLSFSLLNAAGAIMILVSLYYEFNLSAAAIEVFWLMISIVGIVRHFFVNHREPE